LENALNVLTALTLEFLNWVQIQYKHGRSACLEQVFGFAVARLGYDTGYDALPAVVAIAALGMPLNIL
jgi:hypothetical protein